MTYTVTKVRKEYAVDRSDRHIEGVITSAEVIYTRREVVDSNAGNTWRTSHAGACATVRPNELLPARIVPRCPLHQDEPHSTGKDNLEDLPEG